MRFLLSGLLLSCLLVSCLCQEKESSSAEKESWWTGFKSRVKEVLTKWRQDIRLLLDDVLAKAKDMRSWTSDMFDGLKKKLREWVETRPEVPDDEKNEIENFILKLKIPTDKPKIIDP